MDILPEDLRVKILKGVVSYNNTSPVTVFKIPAGALVMGAMLRVKTAFAGTSPTLDFGDEDGATSFIPNASVTEGTEGWYPAGAEITSYGAYLYDGTKKSLRKFYPAEKSATVTIGGSALTAGVAEVYLIYFDLNPLIAEPGEY